MNHEEVHFMWKSKMLTEIRSLTKGHLPHFYLSDSAGQYNLSLVKNVTSSMEEQACKQSTFMGIHDAGLLAILSDVNYKLSVVSSFYQSSIR